MNIKNFRGHFIQTILQRGQMYLKDKRVSKPECDDNGNYTFYVEGTSDYTVNVHISPEGELSGLSCDCPYDYAGYCKHIAAALLYLEKIYDKSISNQSSKSAGQLISSYCRNADLAADADNRFDKKIRIVPELTDRYGKLVYSLKIGYDKMYVVKDVRELYMAFRLGQNIKYGKNLEFRHTYDIIDEQSAAMLELSFNIYSTSAYGYDCRRVLAPDGMNLVRFFEINKDSGVLFDDMLCRIVFDDPSIEFTLHETKTGRYSLKQSGVFHHCYSTGQKACILNRKDSIFHICSRSYSKAVPELLAAVGAKEMYISKKDMSAFYTAVLRPVSQYASIKGLELLDEYKPPELSAKLYLDCDNNGDVIGRLDFIYDEKVYDMLYNKSRNPFCDYYAEAACENLVKRYFSIAQNNTEDPLFIADDDRLYTLMTEGIPLLSEQMEIFTTDRFNKRSVIRPIARPAVGVRPSGSMLELEITADGYSTQELLELLSAYRQGKKYHKLKDGSFAAVTNSISELDELAESLNVSDKKLLKERFKVPAFRMLYLDNIRSTAENIRIDRSAEFKKQVKKYRDTLAYSESISVPEKLDGIMREYQSYGYKWMKTISSYGFGGILADDMGLGKTLQAIALMLDAKQHSEKHIVNLVVCPSSLSLNWESEISKFAPELKTLTIIGTAAERSKKIEQIAEYDVVITSYSLISRDFADYEKYEFYYHFIDEAQYIKNNATQMAKAVKSVNSLHRFALTGTPVENSLAELWSIFDFIMPDYLYGYQYFKKTFETPVVREKSVKATESLQRIVSPFILRRLKSDVLTELPEKTETVLLTDMEDEQSKVYSANVASVRAAVSQSGDDSSERIKILAMLTRLRQLCCDPSLVYDNYKGKSAKLEQCMELIGSCIDSGHKILLFSQFTSMLEIIQSRLDGNGISFYTLTGATKPAQRIKMVNSFNSDDTKVFLISLKAGGTGLNLTGADIVIHYDPWWNISAENQASDRAYRIGQKKNVQIYKMITRHTIEEKIRELQLSKSELADIALGGGTSENSIMRMSSEDILKLLE